MAEPVRIQPRWHSVRDVLRAAWDEHSGDLDTATNMALEIVEADPVLYGDYARPLIHAALRDELRSLRTATRRPVPPPELDPTGRGERLRQAMASPYAWTLSNGKTAGDATHEDFVAEAAMYGGQIADLAWRHRYMQLLADATAKAKRKAAREVLTEEAMAALQRQARGEE